jgi:hypothetical protein
MAKILEDAKKRATDAARFEEMASKMRDLANYCHSASAKSQMQDVARQYQKMADKRRGVSK